MVDFSKHLAVPKPPPPPVDIAAEKDAGVTFLIKHFPRPFTAFSLIGSASYIPELANDVDFACLCIAGVTAFDASLNLRALGFEPCGDYDFPEESDWCAVRRGHLNLMITADPTFYEGYLRATRVCQQLRIMDKPTRITICQIVRDGKL